MLEDPALATLTGTLAVLSAALLLRHRSRVPFTVAVYLPYLWTLALFFVVAELASFRVAIWILAALCFVALREYFSLVDLRIHDRWGLMAAYGAIPLMGYAITIDWYGLFIVSIPVFAFLVVPLVVALGGRNGRQFEGSLLSIGAINFGLFLLVFCLGHVGYLTYYSTWMAFYLVTAVGLCDLFAYITGSRDRTGLSGFALQMLAPAVVTVFVAVILMPWTRLALVHTIALGLAIPILVAAGAFTITHIEADLRIDRDRLPPGRGRILNSLKSFFFTGPVVFHYLRHFLDEF